MAQRRLRRGTVNPTHPSIFYVPLVVVEGALLPLLLLKGAWAMMVFKARNTT
jgi:hypothetical protein